MRSKSSGASGLWPEYPKAVIENGCIFVVLEDKSTIRWGTEDEDQIKDVAAEIEDGLRAIQFLMDRIMQTIKESSDVLECRGFSEYQIKEYLRDSLGNIISKVPIMKNCLSISDDDQMLFYVQ